MRNFIEKKSGFLMGVFAGLTMIYLSAVVTIGCSQIDATRIQNAMDKAEQVTEAVCTTAELFESAGVPQPVLDTCEKAMNTLERDEYVLVSEALDCLAEGETKQDRIVCVAGLEGWSAVADKLGR